MKVGFFAILIIGLIITMPASAAPRTPGIDNPAGITTVPQSSLRSGTVSNPTSNYYNYQNRGNLVVTGNVNQGRHFRGLVPYRSTWEFTDTLGSSSLDSFMRDSARTYYPDVPPGAAQPYYMPSRTVTTLGQPGQPDLQLYHDQLQQQTRQFFRATLPSTTDDELQIRPSKIYRKGRPMSMALEEVEELISTPPVQPKVAVESKKNALENKMEELGRRLQQKVDGTSKPQEKLQDESLKPPTQRTQDYKIDKSEKPPEQTKPGEKPQDEQKQPVDIYSQMEQQIEEQFQKHLEQMKAETDDETKQDDTEQKLPQLDPMSRTATKSDNKRQLLYEFFLKDKSAELEDASWQNAIAQGFFLKKRGRLSTGVGTPRPYKSFDDMVEVKFNEYLQAAGEYMKQGEYYRAADAWTLASTYKPDNPIAYAGKAHALFAAGEYMSSAYFLSRAIEIYPGYMQLKLNLKTVITDKDVLEKRTTDLTNWSITTDAGELFFLLSYVYYRLDNLELAEEAIEITLDKMPESAAVIILKNTIFKAIGRSY